MSSSSSYEIHRLSIGDWMPSPIRSIASDLFSSKIAVGRENGDIEIYESKSKWVVSLRVPGRKDFRLQKLCWSAIENEPGRLFGISLHGLIFEVDFLSLLPINVRHTTGGAAWCMSASPIDKTLAVGCDDGIVRIFSYESGIEYSRIYPSTNAKILSICHHPLDTKVYLGCSDGTIRCHDSVSGRSLFRMRGESIGGSPAMILSLAALSDSTLVSGDSLGNVQIWDGAMGVLSFTMHQHTAEILTIAVSPDEKQIFASGVDSRVINIQLSSSGEESRWIYSAAHRPHSHDVYALAVKRDAADFNGGAVLVSGGLDGKLCLYSVNEYAKHRPLWILPVPARGLAQSSSDGSLLAIKHRDHIDIWLVQCATPSESSIEGDKSSFACKIELKGDEHIHCIALSPSGKYLFASTTAGSRLWTLEPDLKSCTVSLVKLAIPDVASTFALSAVFGDNSAQQLVLALSNGKIAVLDIDEFKTPRFEVKTRHVFDFSSDSGSHGAISQLSLSLDGQFLALSDSAECAYVYDLDRLRMHWRLPRFPSQVTALAIQPTTSNTLAILLASNDLLLFDVENMGCVPWKGADNKDRASSVPAEVRQLSCPLTGLSFDQQSPNKLFLHGPNTLIHVDTNQHIPKKAKVMSVNSLIADSKIIKQQANLKFGKKRKRSEKASGDKDEAISSSNFSVLSIFRSITHVEILPNNRIVVTASVERRWRGPAAQDIPE